MIIFCPGLLIGFHVIKILANPSVEDFSFWIYLQMLNISRKSLTEAIFGVVHMFGTLCLFSNENIEIPQMVLLALVTNIEFELKDF